MICVCMYVCMYIYIYIYIYDSNNDNDNGIYIVRLTTAARRAGEEKEGAACYSS